MISIDYFETEKVNLNGMYTVIDGCVIILLAV
jgi:hypothetical protein